MLGQCQRANNDVLPTTPSITQRWPNDCLLSGLTSRGKINELIFWNFIYLLRNRPENVCFQSPFLSKKAKRNSIEILYKPNQMQEYHLCIS